MNLKRCTIALFLGVLLCHGRAAAQDFRATISGQTTDRSGAAVVNVLVTAVNNESGQTYTARSNADGIYSIPLVLPGVYSVTAEAPGFNRVLQRNVTLHIADKLALNFAMQVGTVQQEVTVSATQEVVERSTASRGQVFDSTKTQNLPLNGRQSYMLMSLSAGVQFNQTQFGSQGFSGTRGWDVNGSYSMNGGWQGLNQFLLDGAPISTNGSWQVSPNVDAIQEFKVMTNTYDAQYGRTGGGTVNTSIKAGGNGMHGTLFDYIRNSVLDANTSQNNLVGAPRGKHIVNDFGGTVGGPIQKDKTFYFFSYEGWRERVPFPVVSSTIPDYLRPRADGSVDLSSLAQKYGAGQYSIYDPLTTTCIKNNAQGQCTQYTRQPFANNVIPANRIDPKALAILSLYPLPNSPGCGPGDSIDTCPDTGNYFGTNLTGRYSYNQYMGRLDHNFGPANRIYGLYTWQRGHEFRDQNGFIGPAITGNINSERDDVNLVLDGTHVFSPTALGDLRLSYGRFHDDFPNGDLKSGLTASKLGLTMPSVPTTLPLPPRIGIDRFNGVIGNQFGDHYTNQLNLAPSMNQTWGLHTLHYGAEVADMIYADDSSGDPGNFGFGTGFTQRDPYRRNQNDGSGLADLYLGYPTSGNVYWNGSLYETYHYFATYIQDDWRVRPNLTLNVGLRWDAEGSINERFNRINAGFCYSCVNPIDGTVNHTKYPNLPNPLKGGVLFAGVNGNPRGPYHTYLNQWQPRFGFSWGFAPKTVMRGGFGLYYAFADQHDTTTGFNRSTPYINSLDGGLTPTNYFSSGNPYPNGILSPTGSSLGLATNVGGGVGYDAKTRRVPRVREFSFGFQRELPAHILLDTEYVGTYTDRMTSGTQFDIITEAQRAQGQADPGFLNANVPNPFYGVLPVTTSIGSSPTISAWKLMRPIPEFDGVFEYTNPLGHAWYSGLQVTTEKKILGNGRGAMTFLLTYTYSKQFERNHFLDNGAYRSADLVKEISYTDRTHVFNFSGVWELPVGRGGWIAKGAQGWAGAALNDWAFDWILTAGSGFPTGPNNNAYITPGCNLHLVKNPSRGEWFNNDTTCWHDMPQWALRTAQDRFSWIRNPWPAQLSVSLQKQFPIRESVHLQARAEAFNALNTPMWGGPDNNFHDRVGFNKSLGIATGFGTIGPQQQNFPRNIQVSLKILF